MMITHDNNAPKSFDILATSLNVLHNYFNSLTKLFLNLYLAKFLNTLTSHSFRE